MSHHHRAAPAQRSRHPDALRHAATPSRARPRSRSSSSGPRNTWVAGTHSRSTLRRLLRRHAGDAAQAATPWSSPTTRPCSSARTTAPTPVEYLLHAIAGLPDRRHRQHRGRPRGRSCTHGQLHGRGRHRPARDPRPVATDRSATATSRSRSPSTSRVTPTTRPCAASSSSPAAARPSTTCSPTRRPSLIDVVTG